MSAEHLEQRSRIRIALLAIVAGVGILGLKYLAYQLSGSVALKSDAIEAFCVVVRKGTSEIFSTIRPCCNGRREIA